MQSSKIFNLIPPNWEHLRGELSLPFVSFDQVYEFLRLSSGNEELTFKGLDSLDNPELLNIFNFVRSQSLRIDSLFPTGFISVLQSGKNMSISFTREQILVLLCHMTLLTLKTSSWHIYWITFENWLTDGRPCAMAYLKGLMSYFYNMMQEVTTYWRNEMITFRRIKYDGSLFPLPDLTLTAVNLHFSGSIGEHSSTIVDFANQDIGFGIGGTQEEILFGSYIELCPSMIFCETMQCDEAIIISNVVKCASYRGYGFDVTFDESFTMLSAASSSTNVIAIDAMDFSGNYKDAFHLQIQRCNLERELRKLVAGYSCFKNELIDSGHWGCGAFGGNKCIKAVLQMIAATITGNRLSFCCFSDEPFYQACNQFLGMPPQSIINLWEILASIDSDSSDFTFYDLLNIPRC